MSYLLSKEANNSVIAHIVMPIMYLEYYINMQIHFYILFTGYSHMLNNKICATVTHKYSKLKRYE